MKDDKEWSRDGDRNDDKEDDKVKDWKFDREDYITEDGMVLGDRGARR